MPGRARHDRLFARFAERGDVHALGEVFDATAPELMRIATHLVGSRELARDLVQSAFLIAIEKRAEFAAERRVLPWLCGIVANLARNERRRSRRKLGAVARGDVEDPRVAAEAAEFRAAFAQAKEAVPEVYRPVLELHLEHGLNAAEIAGALGRPAGTVRTQIVRGLEALRRRLPQGFVAGLVVAPVSAAGLQSTRAFVLSRAAELVPAGGATAGGLALAVMGAGVVNKKLAVLGGIAVLLALGLWIAITAPRDDVVPQEPAAAAQVVAAKPASSSSARGGPSAAASPVPVRQAVDPVPQPALATGSLEVIAKWQHDAAPARGLAIDVVYAGDALGELRPRNMVTDGDGRAIFTSLPPGAITVQASTGLQQAADVTAGSRNSVTLLLEGLPVLGEVVDHQGVPVADADVWVSSEVRYRRVRAGTEPGWGQYGQLTLRTDADGRFATRVTARQCLAAFKQGHGPSLTVYPLRGKGRSPELPIAVVLRLQAAGGTLTASVRGRDGVPVAEAMVLAGSEVPTFQDRENLCTTPAQRVLTDQAGRATLSPLPIGRIPVQVRAKGHGPWRGEVDITAGGIAWLDVQLMEGAIVNGVVLDSTGIPLLDALIHQGPGWSLQASWTTTDSSGAFQLEHLPEGEVQLSAFHEDWGKVTRKLTLKAGTTQRWDVRMPPRAAITGQVFHSDGQPAGSAYVTCYSSALKKGATTHTDAGGRFTLSPLEPGQPYAVNADVPVPGGGRAQVRREAVPAGADIQLRVQAEQIPTARLRGRVLQNSGKAPVGFELHMSSVDGSPGSMHPLAADGTFELGPWSPRRVRLGVCKPGIYRALADFGVYEMVAGTTVDVGDLVLPSTGSVRIRVTGEADQAVAALFRDHRYLDDKRVTTEPMAWEELPPGAYAVSVTRGGASPVCGFAEFEVQAGRVTELAVAVVTGTRREVRLETPNDRPQADQARTPGQLLGGRQFTLRAAAADRTVMLSWTVMVSGDPTFVVLPDTAVELIAASEDGYRGAVSITAGATGPLVVKVAPVK